MKNKKQYRLKRWYPSLPEELPVGAVITFCYGKAEWAYHSNSTLVFKILKHELDNSDFWEEVKQPLFVTEDGVGVLSDIDSLYAVNLTYFNKTKNTLRHSSWLIENSAYKVFYHEANADEYIWRNMRLFSYEDVVEWYGYGFKLGREGIYETLERLAIERSEQ